MRGGWKKRGARERGGKKLGDRCGGMGRRFRRRLSSEWGDGGGADARSRRRGDRASRKKRRSEEAVHPNDERIVAGVTLGAGLDQSRCVPVNLGGKRSKWYRLEAEKRGYIELDK